MKIYPAPHYTMGGLWVDYNLMTTINGLFAAGEANFSDHGANRLGASALMQGLADGYFIAPQTVANYLAKNQFEEISNIHPEVIASLELVKVRIGKLMNAPKPKHSPDYFHQKLGRILWSACGMSREKQSLDAAMKDISELESEFWESIKVTGSESDFNQTLEKAGRVADFIELGYLMCRDASEREESCGAHARVEYLAESGDAKRNDENYSHVAAWKFQDGDSILHKEKLLFEFIKPSVRDYK
jgi:succinate dehydrogenase / fumarate reductase flavoprotein subunit